MKKQYPTYKLGQPLVCVTFQCINDDLLIFVSFVEYTSHRTLKLNFGSFWTFKLNVGNYWTLKLNVGNYWTLKLNVGNYWTLKLNVGNCWTLKLNVNCRNFADSDSDPDNATHTFQRKKGKQRATTVESDSEDSEETSSEDESSDSEDEIIESDVSHTAARYRRKGVKVHWPVEKQKQELNKLGRAILREALGVQRNYKAFIHPGVSEERLRAFAEDPGAKGPKIRNTMIDKNGATTKDLIESLWNQELLLALVKLAEKIVSESKDQRFPPSIDWLSLLSERLYRIYLAVIKSKPRIKHGELESPGQIEQRILDAHLLRNQKNGETGFRHAQKWQTRSEVCAVMIQACEQRGYVDGVHFFRYLLRLVTKMRPGGMSEDEDGVDKVVTIGAGTIEEAVKFTKNLPFRHQYLNDVVEFLDGIPGPGDYLKPGEDEIDSLKRRLDDRLAPPPESLQIWPVITLAFIAFLTGQTISLTSSSEAIP
ncbi:hypothetical protein HHX47_DHR1002050 [Lentinula edodes]|nr:hypothetical protein HHX47_DHR1002050 [Lentinula edodes]